MEDKHNNLDKGWTTARKQLSVLVAVYFRVLLFHSGISRRKKKCPHCKWCRLQSTHNRQSLFLFFLLEACVLNSWFIHGLDCSVHRSSLAPSSLVKVEAYSNNTAGIPFSRSRRACWMACMQSLTAYVKRGFWQLHPHKGVVRHGPYATLRIHKLTLLKDFFILRSCLFVCFVCLNFLSTNLRQNEKLMLV